MNDGERLIGTWLGGGLDKEAGAKTELASWVNPLSLVGAPLAGVVAAITKPRTERRQKEVDDQTWRNMLVPGVGPYNLWKRQAVVNRRAERGEMGPGVPISEKRDATEREEILRESLANFGQIPEDAVDDADVREIRDLTKEWPSGADHPVAGSLGFLAHLFAYGLPGGVLGMPHLGAGFGISKGVEKWTVENPEKAKRLSEIYSKYIGRNVK